MLAYVSLMISFASGSALMLQFFFTLSLQAGAEAGREAREEHVAEGATAQQAAERESKQPGQRTLPGHTVPPTGRRRRELQEQCPECIVLYHRATCSYVTGFINVNVSHLWTTESQNYLCFEDKTKF